MIKRTKVLVWSLLTIASLAIFSLSILNLDQMAGRFGLILVGILFSAWIGSNRIQLGTKDTLTFTHALSIFLGLTLGPFPAIFSMVVGLMLSILIYRVLKRCAGWLQCLGDGLIIISRQVVSLAGGMAIYIILGGPILSGTPALPEAFPTIALAISFSMLFLSFHAVDRWLHNSKPAARRDSILVSLIALAPFPVVVIGAATYSIFSETALVIYGLMLAVAASTFRVLLDLQNGLSRKSRSLQALFNIATSRNLSPEDERYFALIDLAMAELGVGTRAALYTKEANSNRLNLTQMYNLPIANVHFLNHFFDLDPPSASPDSTTLEQLSPDDISHFPEEFQSILEDLRIKQIAIQPLLTGQELIGQLLIFFEQEKIPTSDEIEQLQVFGSQLGQSLKLSREFAATNAELKRRVEQLARLEAIGRQVTASIATEDVYETILYHALQATSATSGRLEILNPETDILVPVAFDSKASDQTIEDFDYSSESHRIAQSAFNTGQVTNVSDIMRDPEFTSSDLEYQSLLCTPIISRGETIGVITLEKIEAGGFSGEDEAFIIQLASQAGNALRNATLYDQLQQRLKEQSLLYQANAQIAESLDSDAVALALADSLAFAVSADAAYVYRYSTLNSALDFIVGVEGTKTIDSRKDQRALEMLIPGVSACIENRRPIQWTSSEVPTEVDDAYLESLGGGTVLLVPLIVGERTLGLVELLRNRIERFERDELRTIQSIAIQASIILENSDLFQQISRSNNRLSAVLNSTREGMLMIDNDGQVAVVNSQLEELIDADPDLLSSLPLQDNEVDVLHSLGYKQNEVRDLVSSLQSGKGHLPGVSTYELPRAERQILRRLETPVHDTRGNLIGWLIVIRDVSEEMQLEESRKHLTEMIVHDLRSPLSAILNSMELLRMQLEAEEQSPIMQQALGIADRSVHQMLALVNALLDLSKLESGQFVLAAIEVDFHELIPHLIDTFLPEAEQAGVFLDYQMDPTLPKMVLDEEKIFRVLSNLLDNALKFTPAGGKVVLEIQNQNSDLRIDVIDTGPGIPADFRERIFDLYAQVPGTKGRRRGTGLGLAFCKLAIEAHQGEIWVEDNPDGGSQFRIRLPVKT